MNHEARAGANKKERHMTCDMWLVTGDMWQVTGDKWHMTGYTWQVTHGVGWTLSQNFSSPALMGWNIWCFEDLEEKDL